MRSTDQSQRKIVADNYGKITAIALDPIEKKPLRRFKPAVGFCPWAAMLQFPVSLCQNYGISMEKNPARCIEVTPQQLVEKALQLIPEGNIGIAYTYNEPLIGYEFVRDCAQLAAKKDFQMWW